MVVQLSIVEAYGIMIFRCEKEVSSNFTSSNATSSGSGGKIYVFRLSELEEYLLELMEWHHNVDSLLHNENNDLQVILIIVIVIVINIIKGSINENISISKVSFLFSAVQTFK